MKLRQFILSFILFLSSISAFAIQRECFLLMAGKEATVNGQMLLAHNNDLTGIEASMLEKIPHDKEIISLSAKAGNYGIPASLLAVEINKGFAEGDAVAINEYGVAVAGGLSLKKDRNKFAENIDPLVPSGLGGGIRYFALQHAKTARQCVEIIGDCYDKFGIAYPSGVGIADTNEIWYLESGGGKSWAAVRIPNDCFFVAANSYRIADIDFSDSANYIYSSNLPYLYERYVKSKEPDAKFNFAEFFGGGMKEKEGNNYYNTRRLWRAISLLKPAAKLSADAETFPLFIHPDKPVSLGICFSILRDYYAATKYDIFSPENKSNPERSIETWKAVHTEVIELYPNLPVSFGARLWTGLSSPFTAVYIPFYFGIKAIPYSYAYAPDEYSEKSAFWLFKKLGDLSKDNYISSMSDWISKRAKFEADLIRLQVDITVTAKTISKKGNSQVANFLTSLVNKFSQSAIELAQQKINQLDKK